MDLIMSLHITILFSCFAQKVEAGASMFCCFDLDEYHPCLWIKALRVTSISYCVQGRFLFQDRVNVITICCDLIGRGKESIFSNATYMLEIGFQDFSISWVFRKY